MKREQLKELGLNDEQVNSVMAQHGTTVNDLNARLSTAETERDNLQEQLTANQTELDTLKESAQGNEEVSSQLADLQTKFDSSKAESEAKLSQQEKDFAIKLALKEASALDESIVLGLLDRDTIKVTESGLQGLNEQLESLKESKSFLFQQKEQDKTKQPSFLQGGSPKAGHEKEYDISKMSIPELKDLKANDPETFKKITQQQ